jgi:hypothetical protein
LQRFEPILTRSGSFFDVSDFIENAAADTN